MKKKSIKKSFDKLLTEYANNINRKNIKPKSKPLKENPFTGSYTSDIPKNYKPSKGELHIQKYLENRNIDFLQEVRFEKLDYLRFDFYLPTLNVCIEFDGIQHFQYVEEFDKGDYSALEKRQLFDKQKTEFCKKNFIRLIRISYKYQKDISKILNRKLFPKSN